MSLRRSGRVHKVVNYKEKGPDDGDIFDDDHDQIQRMIEYRRALRNGSGVSYRDVLELGSMQNSAADKILESNHLYIFAMNTWCLEHHDQILARAGTDDVDHVFTEGWNMWNEFYKTHRGEGQQRVLNEYNAQQLHILSTPKNWLMPIKIWAGFYSKLPESENCFEILTEETPWGSIDLDEFYAHPGNQARYPNEYREYLGSLQ
jgi:hypothetical protein